MSENYSKSKYLVCVDNSDVARIALRFACIKARKRNLQVDILHVITPVDLQPLDAVKEKMEEDLRAEAEKMLSKLAEEAYELTGRHPSMLIRIGSITEQIITHALEDHGANMLVLGIEPEKGSRGKLASKIISQMGHKLLIPLMLVPGNLTDQQMEELG